MRFNIGEETSQAELMKWTNKRCTVRCLTKESRDYLPTPLDTQRKMVRTSRVLPLTRDAAAKRSTQVQDTHDLSSSCACTLATLSLLCISDTEQT